MSEAVRVGIVWLLAFLFAVAEVEIEGAHGWAERLPTWYRVRGRAARLFGLALRGKPMTGYHLSMFALSACAFHLPFAFGADWSLSAELVVLAAYAVFVVVWDFLWFALNPAYGPRRFRAGAIWWLPEPWLLGVPVDYLVALGGSFVLAALAWAIDGGPLLRDHAILVLAAAALTALAAALAPIYHRWYVRMRAPGADERGLAPIQPPPDEP
jgi:hypothetical protein